MKLTLPNGQYIKTEEGLDISIPIVEGDNNVNAWYCDPVRIEPVRAGDFIGDVNQGGSVNFKNIKLNPHGNGTHTECVGHISKEKHTINQCLKEFHFIGNVISVRAKEYFNEKYQMTDWVIDENELGQNLNCELLIIRTDHNSDEKKTHHYSGNNPPYLTKKAVERINSWGVKHLMIDLPSVDRESDDGALIAHKTFWNYPENPLVNKTITELIYVDNAIQDGEYLVTIQIMSIESDASPSKIVLYKLYHD